MLCNRIIAAVLLLTPPCAGAAPGIASCPMTIGSLGQSHHLLAADVFDGSPSKQASLVPVNGRWDLAAIRDTADPDGFYLVCGYAGISDKKVISLPRTVSVCELSNLKGAVGVVCK